MIFYDFEFNLLLIEPKIISWRLTKYYNEIGVLEAHIPISSGATRLVMENDFLVCSVGGEFAIVTGKQLGKELVIYGKTCNWLLSKRVVLPFQSETSSVGEFVKRRFETAYSSCDDVIFGTMKQGSTNTFSSEKPMLLSDEIFSALKRDSLGNELVFDKINKKWVFNILEGEEKLLMISEANKNASGTQITKNILEYANFCYFESDGEYISFGEADDGIYRFETYILSGDENDAKKHLLDKEKEFLTEVIATGPEYKKDYNLGDTVRVQIIKNDYKVTKRLRIKGVELLSKQTGYIEKPIFEEV